MKFINRIKNNKLLYFLGVLIIGVFIALIARFTYAYLAASINEARENVTINSDETDKLDFEIGEPLSIDATPTTLPENGANLVDTTTAKAILTANSTNNTAEYSYWVYFTISNNTFIYSDGSTPEIILTVTDPDGNPVTNIEGLTYGTFNGVAGFDITTQNGTFVIASDYVITSNSSTQATEQTWNFTLTYLNLSYDQSANYGNSMTTEVSMMKEEKKPTLADYITGLYTTDGENGLYYHDGVGTYTNADQEAGDGSYRFSGANPNNYVCFGSDVATCPTDNLYRIIGVFGYQVKLIKYDFANKKVLGADPEGTATLNSKPNYKGNLRSFPFYLWSGSSSNSSNTWSVSTLNTNILNESYLDTLGRTWSSKIATTRWKVGGNTTGNIYDVAVKSAYQNEIVSPAANITYNAKVGLMYVSDYGYAASPINWNTNLSRYGSTTTVRDNNWMWMGASEWTISRSSDDTTDVFSIIDSGSITYYVFVTSVTHCVRPVFYLNSNVTFTGGTGTQTDPIRIA